MNASKKPAFKKVIMPKAKAKELNSIEIMVK